MWAYSGACPLGSRRATMTARLSSTRARPLAALIVPRSHSLAAALVKRHTRSSSLDRPRKRALRTSTAPAERRYGGRGGDRVGRAAGGPAGEAEPRCAHSAGLQRRPAGRPSAPDLRRPWCAESRPRPPPRRRSLPLTPPCCPSCAPSRTELDVAQLTEQLLSRKRDDASTSGRAPLPLLLKVGRLLTVLARRAVLQPGSTLDTAAPAPPARRPSPAPTRWRR
jgi:hypothetical protein